MKKFLLHTLFILILLLPARSHAIGILFDINNASLFSTGDSDNDTFSKRCGKLAKPNKITGNIVRCANAVVNLGGDRIISNFVKPFSAVVFYVIIVAIVFYGIQMMYGVARKDVTLMMVIKILAVLFVCGPQGYLFLKNTRNVLIGFPKNISSSLVADPGATHDKMVEYPPGSGLMIVDTLIPNPAYDASNPTPGVYEMIPNPDTNATPNQEHDITLLGGALDILGIKNLMCKPDGTMLVGGLKCPSYRMEDLYDKFDESILRIFGVSDSDIYSGQKNPELFMGVVVLVAGLIFTGGWGVMFAVQLMLLATATLFAIAQMALFFIIVAIAINVLIAIAPIALACMLFKSTEGITRKWLSYLFIYSLQPIILVAFMVITVTILEDLTKKYKDINLYDKVGMNIVNANGNPNTKMSIFNCFGASSSSDVSQDQLSDTSNFNSIVSNTMRQSVSNNLRIGGATSGSVKDESKQGCDIKAFALNIDDTGASVASNQIQGGDLRAATAINIAIIILQFILLSFIKQMPQMIARMANAGGMEAAVSVATNPTDKYLPAAAQKGGGLLGSMAKRSF